VQSIASSKDIASLLSLLMQTEYSKSLSDFGGVEIKQSLIDFALSGNLAKDMDAVIRLTPHQDKHTIRGIAERWTFHNVKLALEAKTEGKGFADIERYLIDYGRYPRIIIKDIMKEDSAERMLQRFINNSPSSEVLTKALAVYNEHKNVSESIAAIDSEYYKSMEDMLHQFYNKGEPAGRIIKMEIDMKNMLTLIRAKWRGADFDAVAGGLINGGAVAIADMKKAYTSSEGVEPLVQNINAFELKDAIARYNQNKRLVTFEIAMRNSIHSAALKVLSHSVLSLSSVIAYIYLKEIEVSTLRILVKGKAYGLGKDELSELMVWKAN
jgi:V/A-type H+-transporting ATPase subunit C